MSIERQREAAPRNVKKAQAGARDKQTISRLTTEMRSIRSVSQKRRTGRP